MYYDLMVADWVLALGTFFLILALIGALVSGLRTQRAERDAASRPQVGTCEHLSWLDRVNGLRCPSCDECGDPKCKCHAAAAAGLAFGHYYVPGGDRG